MKDKVQRYNNVIDGFQYKNDTFIIIIIIEKLNNFIDGF